MAITTGIDIVQVRRIKGLIQRKKKAFLTRVFSPDEIAYCEAKAHKYLHYAARFAAKEAFLKALHDSRPTFSYKDIRVHKQGNVPVIDIAPCHRRACARMRSVSLSLSHEKEFAVAVVVIEFTALKRRG